MLQQAPAQRYQIYMPFQSLHNSNFYLKLPGPLQIGMGTVLDSHDAT